MHTGYVTSDDMVTFKAAKYRKRPSNAIAKIPESIPVEDYRYVVASQVDNGMGDIYWQVSDNHCQVVSIQTLPESGQ